MSVNKHMFEGLDADHRARLHSFLSVWIKVRRVIDFGSFGIAMKVREHTRGVIPEDLASCLSHGDQFPETEWSGIDSEDSGQVPDELIHFCASVSGSIESRIFSA